MWRFIASICILLSYPLSLLANTNINAQEAMERNFIATKVSAFNGSVRMVLITDQGQERVRKLVMWSKLKVNSTDSEVLMRFEEPADIKGTGFLQIENSAGDDGVWVYLPALGKVRRMVASNKRDSFFGTDFSYGDVLLPAVDKYEQTYRRTEIIDGSECYVIESKPITVKTRDDSGYSRKVLWLDAKNYLERKVEYYDLAGQLLKTQRTYDLQQVESVPLRWMPMRREMVNHQTGHRTVYQFDHFSLDQKISESFFTTRNLERQ